MTTLAYAYAVASGQPVYAGRFRPPVASMALATDPAVFAGSASRGPPQASFALSTDAAVFAGSASTRPSVNTAMLGDSLTAASYGSLYPYLWTFGRNGGVLKLVSNGGVASQTIGDVLARVDNSYTHASQPGLAGLTPLGFVALRIGTNNVRGGAALDATAKTQFQNLIAKILTYAEYALVFAIPPIGPPNPSTGVQASNAWLASQCYEGGGGNARVRWIDDTATVNDGTGNWASGYAPADGIHYGNKAAYQMGVDGATAIASFLAGFSFPSPVSHDASDVYPAQPQWVSNAQMAGTGGSNGLGSGQMPNGWTLSSNRAGQVWSTAIVAADVGDSNPTPWLRLTPQTVTTGAGELILLRTTLAGRTITNADPTALDWMYEARFNALDGSKFGAWDFSIYGDGTTEVVGPTTHLQMQGGTINGTVVVRAALPRNMAAAISHPSLSLQWNLATVAAGSGGGMGSVDVRCLTIRG